MSPTTMQPTLLEIQPASRAAWPVAAVIAFAAIWGAAEAWSETAPRPHGAGEFLLTNVHVVPMDSPRVLHDQSIWVRDGRIAGIGDAESLIDEEVRVVDGLGGFVLPGLVDGHVHVDEALGSRPEFGDAPLYLAAGITSVINLHGNATGLAWRERIASGELVAPYFYTAGSFLNEPLITTAEEVVAELERQKDAGVDILKFREIPGETTVGLSREAYRTLVRTARELQIPLVGHTPHNLRLAAVLEEGQSLAHLNALLEHDLMPDPTARFQRWARVTKWSTLALLIVAAVTLVGALALGSDRRSVVMAASSSLALGSLFLYTWESTYWAGDDALIALLIALGVLLGLTALATLAAAARRGGTPRRRGALILLLAPLLTLVGSLAYWLPLAYSTRGHALNDLADRLRDADVSVITTMVVDSGVTPDRLQPWGRYLHDDARWLGESHPSAEPPLHIPDLRVARWIHLEKTLVRKLQDAGVRLVTGTDAGGYPLMIPGIAFRLELELLRDAGLTPYEILHAATVAPAELLGRSEELGTIEVGKRADLLLVSSNPLEDLSTLLEPAGVSVAGHWLSREQLDSLLQGLAAQSP